MQTGFTRPGAADRYDYARRRAALRATWFPRTPAALRSAETAGLVLRFVAGHSESTAQEAALADEAREHGDFFRLKLQVDC